MTLWELREAVEKALTVEIVLGFYLLSVLAIIAFMRGARRPRKDREEG